MNPLKCAFDVHAGDFLRFVVHKKSIKINQNKTKAIVSTSAQTTMKQFAIFVGRNQLPQKIYFKSQWQNASFFTTTSTEERRRIQMRIRT